MADTTPSGPGIRLYDQTGTLIPIPGPPPLPIDPSIRPEGVDHDYRDRFRLYPSRNLTPGRIVQILEQADGGDLYEWIQLCEEMVEKDPKIGSVLQTRVSAVLGVDHNVAVAKLDEIGVAKQSTAEEIAKFCGTGLAHANTDELIADCMDSVGKPLSVDWIDWGDDADGRRVPQLFRQIPTTHIRWSWREDVIRIWNPHGTSAQSMGDYGFEPLPYTTVRALNNRRRDHPTRAGLLRTLIWYYLFKNIALKDWIAYGDRYGLPWRVIKLDPLEFKNPEMYAAARTALRNMGTDASGVISKAADLELIAPHTAEGTNVFKLVIDYIDAAIAQCVLGHELSSQGSKGTGNLGISAALQVRQDILEGDCQFISEIIKRDVLVPMVGWNFGWENVGLTPDFVFDFEPPKDLVADARIMETVAGTFPTLEFSKQQIRDVYGFDAPLEGSATDEESDVLLPAQKQANPFGQGAAGPAVEPDATPEPPPVDQEGQPEAPEDVTVNSMRDDLNTLEADFAAFSATRRNAAATSNQKKIDRLTARGSRLVTRKAATWRGQLEQLVAEGAGEGIGFAEMAARLVAAYPKLNASEVEKALREQMTLARLFGRQKNV